MPENHVAVLGVIYPGVEDFISDYLGSLAKQTFRKFDLILINDGFENFEKLKSKYDSDLNIIEFKKTASPAGLREFGINWIRNAGYEYLIFTDSDDLFSANRIENNIDNLQDVDVIINDLTIMSSTGRVLISHYLSKRIKNKAEISIDFITDKNIFGMSNTAIKLRCLKKDVEIESKLIAIDWYIFSKLIMEGANAAFISDAETFYRQHSNNTVGMLSEVSEENLINYINVKLLHYKSLRNIREDFMRLYDEFDNLKKKMRDVFYAADYLDKIKLLEISNPLWWELARRPEELGL